MVLGAIIVGSMAGRYAARRHYESMAAAQAQQSQIDQAQAQAAQATQAAQAAQAHAAQLASQVQESNQGKMDMFQELEKLGSLRQRDIITDEEFQKLKARLLSNIDSLLTKG